MIDTRNLVNIDISGQTITVGEPCNILGTTFQNPIFNYIVLGSGAISGDNEFVPDGSIDLTDGLAFTFLCKLECTNAGGTVKIFGYALTAAQLSSTNLFLVRYYKETDTWGVFCFADVNTNSLDGSKIYPGSISTSAIANLAISSAKIADEAVSLAKMAKIADGTYLGNTSGSSSVPQALTKSQMRSSLSIFTPTQTLLIPVSFEASEQCENTITIGHACSMAATYTSGVVVKALAGTDTGVITIKKNGVAVASGTITFAISAALNAAGVVGSFSSISLAAGDTLSFSAAKGTAGGKVLISTTLTQTA